MYFVINKVITMKSSAMTDEAIAAEFGARIAQLRLERNLTQQQVAEAVGLSRVSYGKLEAGEAKLVNVIAALRVLGKLEILEQIVPETTFSPMELLKLKGKRRQRASGNRTPDASNATQQALDW